MKVSNGMDLLGMTEDEFTEFVQSYIDRVDAQCRKNEFTEAGSVLREMVHEVVQRRQRMFSHLLHDAVTVSQALDVVIAGLQFAIGKGAERETR